MRRLSAEMKARLAVFGLMAMCFASAYRNARVSEKASRLERQRDELAWRAIYLLTNADAAKRAAFEADLNRAVNAVESEDGDDAMYDWKNDPRRAEREIGGRK